MKSLTNMSYYITIIYVDLTCVIGGGSGVTSGLSKLGKKQYKFFGTYEVKYKNG